jgi:hypothetical protein
LSTTPKVDHDEDGEHAGTIHATHWDLVDDYPDVREIDEPGHDHAPDDGGADLDISGVAWGEAVE